jgi:hypothetical protein
MRFGIAAFLVTSVGCLDAVDALDPNVGQPLADRCVNQDSDPDLEVSFSRHVLPILEAEAGPVGCACHQPADPNPIGLEQTGLDLSSFDGVRAGGINSGAQIIVEAQPCDSILFQKISPGPPFGARMPFNGPPFLSEEDRRLIADWIAEGARDN